MNRIGLKDYLLNEASDNDLLDCAKAYDAANQYGHFDTYDSVEEAAKFCGWDVATALSEIRTGVPDIQVEIDSTNDDNFIEGTVTVEGESCYFYRPNSTRSTEDYDSVVFEPFRPDGFEGDIEEIELPTAIDQNRELAELVVSVAAEPYMDPDKAVGREQSIDSLCDEKTEVSESMRYGMEGVGMPMLDAAEHLANY